MMFKLLAMAGGAPRPEDAQCGDYISRAGTMLGPVARTIGQLGTHWKPRKYDCIANTTDQH